MNFLLFTGILVGVIFLGKKDKNTPGLGAAKESISIDDLLFDRHKLNKKYDYYQIIFTVRTYGVSDSFLERDAFHSIELVREIDEMKKLIQRQKGVELISIQIFAYSKNKLKKTYVVI